VYFIIVAFSLFLFIKYLNKLNDKLGQIPTSKLAQKMNLAKPEEEPETKLCPFCYTEISYKATRCPHCTSKLSKKNNNITE
jgi:large conductance mechanosensitive channel